MASTASVGDARPPLLSRERTIAKPGFNRWLVPPAALCIHLCIGMAYGFSRVLEAAAGRAPRRRRQGAAGMLAGAVTFAEKSIGTLNALFATDCNWSQFDLGWMFTFFFVLLGISAAIWGGWLERVGPRKAGVVVGALLVRRLAHLRARRLHPSALADVAGCRRHRRHRPRARLHLAGLHADQMVPRPPRHGDRHGHHGLWRRRHDRLAAGHHPDEPLHGTPTDARASGRPSSLMARHLLRLHADRRLRLPVAAGGLEARRLDAARQRQRHDHASNVHLNDAHKTPQFWLSVARAVHERVGRHRHHRRWPRPCCRRPSAAR